MSTATLRFAIAATIFILAACAGAPPPKFYDSELAVLAPLIASGRYEEAVNRSFTIFTYDWDEAARLRAELEKSPGYVRALKEEFAKRTAIEVDGQTAEAIRIAAREGFISGAEVSSYLASAERTRAELAAQEAAAAQNKRFECRNAEHCRKAFALAQIFVNSNSDMKIQVATDTIVETFNPTESYKIGLRVVRTPGARDSAEITLDVICKDCSSRSMHSKVLQIQGSFGPFITARLVE